MKITSKLSKDELRYQFLAKLPFCVMIMANDNLGGSILAVLVPLIVS